MWAKIKRQAKTVEKSTPKETGKKLENRIRLLKMLSLLSEKIQEDLSFIEKKGEVNKNEAVKEQE